MSAAMVGFVIGFAVGFGLAAVVLADRWVR